MTNSNCGCAYPGVNCALYSEGREVLLVIVTNHGKERTKERLGISKKIADKNAERAYQNGIRRDETTGRLRRYLDKLYYKARADNIIVYNRHIYIFNGNVLITVLNLPNEFNGAEKRVQHRNH